MTHQHLETLNYCIRLIFQFHHTRRQLNREIILNLVTKSINEYLQIDFVWCRLITQICLLLDAFNIINSQCDGFFP